MAKAIGSSKLLDRYERLKSSVANMRDAAKVASERATVFVFSGVGGYGVGWVDGWATRTNRKLTIGTSSVRWPMAIGLVSGLGGALGVKLLGQSGADVALGLGSGMVSGELALAGQKAGVAPPSP